MKRQKALTWILPSIAVSVGHATQEPDFCIFPITKSFYLPHGINSRTMSVSINKLNVFFAPAVLHLSVTKSLVKITIPKDKVRVYRSKEQYQNYAAGSK